MPDLGNSRTQFQSQTLSHPNTLTETDLIEYTTLKNLVKLHFDMTNITQISTIRVYDKTDGTNYRLLSIKEFPTDYDTGVETIVAILDGAGQDMKVTLESTILEGSAKDIVTTSRETTRL